VYLWAQAVSEAQTDEVAAVLKAVRRQSLDAPEGIISIDESTLHTWRPVYIGRIRGDGQFDVAWGSEKPVRPIPFPNSRSRASWEAFLEDLHRTWGGWANSGAGARPHSNPDPSADPPAASPPSPAREDPAKSAGLQPGWGTAGAAFHRTTAATATRCDPS
jgi:urea transport system substrate-binding protein